MLDNDSRIQLKEKILGWQPTKNDVDLKTIIALNENTHKKLCSIQNWKASYKDQISEDEILYRALLDAICGVNSFKNDKCICFSLIQYYREHQLSEDIIEELMFITCSNLFDISYYDETHIEATCKIIANGEDLKSEKSVIDNIIKDSKKYNPLFIDKLNKVNKNIIITDRLDWSLINEDQMSEEFRSKYEQLLNQKSDQSRMRFKNDF